MQAAIAGLALLFAQQQAQSPVEDYRLTEAASVILPSNVVPEHLAGSESGAFIVWGRGQRGVWLFQPATHSGSDLRVDELDQVAGVSFVTDTTFEVVDAGLSEILVFGITGDLLERRKFDRADSLAHVFRVSNQWMGVTRYEARVALRGLEDGATNTLEIPGFAGRGAFHISSDANAFLFSLVSDPFTIVRAPLITLQLETWPAQNFPFEHDRWIALPPVGVGKGYLQTLVDPASDDRLLIRFDQHGRVLRASPLAIPIAIVGASATGNKVFVARNVGTIEIVIYESK